MNHEDDTPRSEPEPTDLDTPDEPTFDGTDDVDTGDVPTARAPSGADPRVWDPEEKRWVSASAPEPPSPRPDTTAETPSLPLVATIDPPPPAQRSRGPEGLPAWLAAVLAGAVGGALAVVVMLFFPGTADPRDPLPGRAAPTLTAPDFDPSSLVRDARPWVVSVLATREDGRRSGSGVVLDGEGTLATTADTVEGADNAEVTLSTGQRVVARVLGVDEHTGLAILRAEAEGLAAVPRGSAEFIRLGEPVVSVSSTRHTYASASTGIVSALARPPDADDEEPILHLVTIETVGRPTAGALLVGVGGTAVGMTVTVNGANEETHALPIDVVWSVHDQIVRGAAVDHPFIGLVVTEFEDDVRLPAGTLALAVADVVVGSPADEAGIRRGDIIVGVDGDRIEGGLTLLTRLHEADEEIELALLRDRDIEIVGIRVQRRLAAA